MLDVASVCTLCCMFLRVVGSCCAKFESSQTFSYVQTDATMLRPFEQGLKVIERLIHCVQ